MVGHKYTDEERRFMVEFVPGHSYREIQEAFSQKFGWDISLNQVKGYIANHRLNTGRTGRFVKGNVPPNKGKKGVWDKRCEKTWFKKGNVPKNHRPVGSERISKDGYAEIKVEEPNKWRKKHIVLWESVHGLVPKGYCIIFRDNDKKNITIENLIMIKKATNARLNQTGMSEYTNEFKDTAIIIAELISKKSSAQKRRKKKSKKR